MKNYGGSLQVEGFGVIWDVFQQIVNEPWFPDDDDRKATFSAYLIRAFESGIKDKRALYDTCARTAQDWFVGNRH